MIIDCIRDGIARRACMEADLLPEGVYPPLRQADDSLIGSIPSYIGNVEVRSIEKRLLIGLPFMGKSNRDAREVR